MSLLKKLTIKTRITDRKHKQTFKQEEEQRQTKQLHFSFETLIHPKFCRHADVNENYAANLSFKKFLDKWKD